VPVVGPFLVLGWYSGLRQIPDLGDRVEQMGIEHFLAIGAVAAFDKGVRVGLASLDVPELDLVPADTIR
jgi:hypothetical protein